MNDLAFLLLGVGNGAVYAALGLALVMTFKSSGVVNFATGAVALYAAYTYAYLRRGEFLNPIPGFDKTVDLGGKWDVLPAALLAVALSAVLGMLLYLVVFRPMRRAPALAKAVAAIGVMLVLQALLAMRVDETPPPVAAIFPRESFTVGETVVSTEGLWLGVVVVGLAALAALVLRYTRFGVATEAAAESERGALVTGLSPDRIALSNWALSSATAGVGGVLISPMVPLNPVAYTMFIVPALAAALVGNFSSISLTVLAGLAIGMLSSEAQKLQTTVDWFPDSGVAQAIPLLLILIFLLVRGQRLPGRGAVAKQDLGRSPRPTRLLVPTVVGVAVGVVALLVTSGSVRLAVIASLVFAVIALSQVVVTGYAGQVSLAQLTLAGASAYSLARFSEQLHIPFPFAPLLAALAAMVIGVVVGLPALRVRGLPLMVATLALAVFLEAFWFNNPSLNGGGAQAMVTPPSIFGLDLSIGAGEGYPQLAFGVLCLVVLTLCALGVAWLRRSRLGAAMLAVRANERSAAASGVNVGAVKLTAFAIASFLAGLGGALMAYQTSNMATADLFRVFTAITLFAVFYIAGVTSVSGALLAGVMAPGALLSYWLDIGDYYVLASGVLLVVTVVFNPDGLVGQLHRIPLPAVLRARPASIGDIPVAPSPEHTPTAVGGPVLAVEDLTVRYGAVTAVSGVDFGLLRGEIVGLIGPNGAGKTTLVDAISGFAPCTGRIRLGETDLAALAPHRRSRAGLGRTFQDIELYDELSVLENVTVGVDAGDDDPHRTVREVLALLQIGDLAETTAADLSQGQRQLVSVARMLAGRPTVALLDEPAAGLDSGESRWLGERLAAARGSGVSMLLIDHDMDLVLSVCDRVVVLDLGSVIATGTPEEIRTDPRVMAAYLGTEGPAPEEAAPEEAAAEEAAPEDPAPEEPDHPAPDDPAGARPVRNDSDAPEVIA